MHSRPVQHMHSIFMSVQLRWLLLLIRQIAINKQRREAAVDSRSIFVTAVKDEERIRFPEEVLLIQLIATELQHHRLLKGNEAINRVRGHPLCRGSDHRSRGNARKPQTKFDVPMLLLRQHQAKERDATSSNFFFLIGNEKSTILQGECE